MSKSASSNSRQASRQRTAARERRGSVLKVRMNEQELSRLDAYARKLGVNRSEAVRYLLEGTESKKAGVTTPLETIADASAKLGMLGALNRRIGNNLNQLMKVMNTRARQDDWISVGEEVMHGVTLGEVSHCTDVLEAQDDAIAALLKDLREGV